MSDYSKHKTEDQRPDPKQTSRVQPRRPHWRFEDLEIWNKAVDLAVKFHRIAERLDRRRLYRYAEQLRARACPFPTILRKDRVAYTTQEFIQYLNSPDDLCSKMHPCCWCSKGSAYSTAQGGLNC